MNIFGLLSYINKISLLVFFITTLVVGYQVYVLKKEKTKKQTPSIPDFKEKIFSNETANFTSLPSFLTKKEIKTVNYSKLVFLIIFLLTIVIVIFVISLINKNNVTNNQALVNPKITITKIPTAVKSKDELKPTPKNSLIPSPTEIIATIVPSLILNPTNVVPADITPTIISDPIVTPAPSAIVPTVNSEPTTVPTEIILAQVPSSIPTLNSANGQKITDSVPKVLPETGSWEKGLLIIGVAISTIFFSFWF